MYFSPNFLRILIDERNFGYFSIGFTVELSDLAVEQEAEIIKNPYQFLNLPIDSGPEDARKNYIALAKKYHPDLVNPSFDTTNIRRLYSQQDIESLKLNFSLDELVYMVDKLNEYSKKVASVLQKNMSNQSNQELPEKSPELESYSIKSWDALTRLASKKMILLNRAYQEIKSRYNPQEWNRLFGYDVETVFDKEQGNTKIIRLEGRGEVTIFPNNDDYFAAGPYLSFDFGPDETHSWEPWYYRHDLHLKHLFAHTEIGNERLINKVLLEPFIDTFNLDENKAKILTKLLSARDKTHEIMEKVGVQKARGLDPHSDDHIRSLRFERQINEILYLDRNLCPVSKISVNVEFEDGKMILEDHTRTIFSETDYMLFLTLAYGPLIQ